ncbi:MAG: EpsI family protein [Sedimentisphaerales bacterium]
MKERKKLHNRSLITAAVAAAFMMVIFGAAHRSLTTLLSIPENFSSMPPDALDEFPMQINQWVGVEEPLDEAVIEATDTDAHISRRYYRYDSPQEVWLYIAAGKRARDLMPHRPEVCYIGAGWTLTNNDSRELSLDSGTVLPCNIFQFTKGTLNPKKIVILDYYIVDGQICRDISLLRSKIWRGSGYVDYVIQVQVFAPVTADRSIESTEKMVRGFACESCSSIIRVLEDVKTSKDPNTQGQSQEGYSMRSENY